MTVECGRMWCVMDEDDRGVKSRISELKYLENLAETSGMPGVNGSEVNMPRQGDMYCWPFPAHVIAVLSSLDDSGFPCYANKFKPGYAANSVRSCRDSKVYLEILKTTASPVSPPDTYSSDESSWYPMSSCRSQRGLAAGRREIVVRGRTCTCPRFATTTSCPAPGPKPGCTPRCSSGRRWY